MAWCRAGLRALGTVSASLLVVLHSAQATPPAEAFGRLPSIELARLSPDGKHLSIVKPVDGKNKCVFVDLTKPDEQPYVVGMDGGLASGVFWKTNDKAICVFHATLTYRHLKAVDTWSRALSVTPSTRTAVLLMWDAPYFRENLDEGTIIDIDAGDPNHVLMQEVDREDRDLLFGLYQVSLDTGHAQVLLHQTRDTIQFLTDGYGHLIGHIDQDSDLTNHVMVGKSEVFSYQVRGSPDFQIEGFTLGQNPQIVAKRASAYGTTGLYAWSSAGSSSTLFENPAYDIDEVLTDERNGRVIGITYVDDVQRSVYFDPDLQKVQTTLEKIYPGQTVSILSRDDSGSTYVIGTQGPKNPPALLVYTAADHHAKLIDEAYGSLQPSDLGDMKPYPYKTRDGLDIHAYLTLPPGHEPHNLPAVIFPHGGPEERDSLGFDWWAQFMASRGYAVLQPNFRGSSGYGWSFVKAGDGEWAGKVQNDVQDGVRKLVADGIADPRRICIVGASYGGYMALAGATFSPDLYACAVSYAGVSDVERTLYTGTAFESETSSIWKRRVGADVDSRKPEAVSPVNFAANVKIPVLLIHSDRDTTVPIEQSEIEERALKDAGKQVEFVKLEGDDHYLEFGPTRVQMLKEIERFLAAHIGAAAAKPAQ
ncbi:MAG: S9 family peptidase [Rhizomicrobium sp.]|jgi:acetyl esterase/lipase